MEKAMRVIGKGDFNPDTTRSGRCSSSGESEDSTSSSDADHQNDGTAPHTEVEGSGVIFCSTRNHSYNPQGGECR
eukprot:5409148-Amphidinium_carterae.1